MRALQCLQWNEIQPVVLDLSIESEHQGQNGLHNFFHLLSSRAERRHLSAVSKTDVNSKKSSVEVRYWEPSSLHLWKWHSRKVGTAKVALSVCNMRVVLFARPSNSLRPSLISQD